MKRKLRVPSPALVIACISLAVALSGASYAAVALPKNSVGTKQLRTNAVKSVKIADDQVTGADVAEATLGQVPAAANAANASGLQCAGCVEGGDLANGSVTSAKLANGSVVGAKLGPDSVNSANVASESLTGQDIADDSLTSFEINESTLLAVPSAVNATNAASLGGLPSSSYTQRVNFSYSANTGSQYTNILNTSTLRLDAACLGGDDLWVRATTTYAPAWIRMLGGGGDSSFQTDETVLFNFGSGSVIGTYVAGSVIVSLVFSTWENGVGDDCRLFGQAFV